MTTFRPRFSPSRRTLLEGHRRHGRRPDPAAALSLSEEEKKLNFYNWDTYIGETTLADFEPRPPALRPRWISSPTTTNCSPSSRAAIPAMT